MAAWSSALDFAVISFFVGSVVVVLLSLFAFVIAVLSAGVALFLLGLVVVVLDEVVVLFSLVSLAVVYCDSGHTVAVLLRVTTKDQIE